MGALATSLPRTCPALTRGKQAPAPVVSLLYADGKRVTFQHGSAGRPWWVGLSQGLTASQP